MESYSLTRRNGDALETGANLDTFFPDWKGPRERWLFVAPHDDDLCLGSGLLLQKAVSENVPLSILITSDGGMGFGSTVPKESIQKTRRKETLESFGILGIGDVSWLDFPDGSLAQFAGSRAAKPGDPCVIEGHTGIQNAFTAWLRKVRPTRVFVPSNADLHPDHKIVHQELLISLFHAAGDIWPQLGSQLDTLPAIYEMAIYCAFNAPPTMKLEAPGAAFEKKLQSIMAYRSQKQITSLVENFRKSGPVEFFRQADFNLYEPSAYNKLFE